jgi:hypothetical protein
MATEPNGPAASPSGSPYGAQGQPAAPGTVLSPIPAAASAPDAAPADRSAQTAIAGSDPLPPSTPGFGERGRMRRRLHFLRKARELAYRDLGGLVFDLHRFGKRHDELVIAKLATLDHIDGELRALEAVLKERQSVTVLREAGIAACPRCAAIHGSDDRFCPSCGMPVGVHADHPVGAPTTASVLGATSAQVQAQPAPQAGGAPEPATAPAQPNTAPPSPPRAGERSSSELLRPPSSLQGSADGEEQPTHVVASNEGSQAREQPTQGFDPPTMAG